MTFTESTRAITRIANLQNELLDHTGHVRKGTSRDDRKMLVDEINRLREMVGWEPCRISRTGTKR